MRKFLYNYQTIIRFERPVTRHAFRLRCVPCENAAQRCVRRELYIYPQGRFLCDTDAWGNGIQYGSIEAPHDAFVFVSSGEVRRDDCPLPGPPPSYIYKVGSARACLSPAMLPLLDGCREMPPLEAALCLSRRVYGLMSYRPGTTHAGTTAAEAFAGRAGVCQDYAHILLALCRAAGIAARYVDGFVPGVGATHAWVEVYDGGAWLGVDPTNDRLTGTGYIKLAHGRDADDCPVNRGVFLGGGRQETEIRVIVEEI